MRIAFLGTRGVPATYSGFETFVENLGVRLVERGHEVTVYCRHHHYPHRLTSFRGIRLRYVPGLVSKHLDTISHTFVSSLHACFSRYDLVVMCISGNSPVSILPRLVGTRVVLNVDGSDWRRQKWGRFARFYIRLSEWLATRFPNATVTDSKVMQRYYLERFGAQTTCIAYGADMPPGEPTGILKRLGLESRQYILLVGRLVPENCAHHLVDAYRELDTPVRCVVVGDAPYAKDYISELHRRGPSVLFPGYIFGDGYRELMRHARLVVLCSEVGGTHPVLLEAMASGNCVVVNDTPANVEVVGEAGILYDGQEGARSLAVVLSSLLSNESRLADYRVRARERAESHYSWDRVADEYEMLFTSLIGGKFESTAGGDTRPISPAPETAET